MVVTTEDYLKIRIPYIKTTFIFLFALAFFLFSIWSLILFLLNKNFYFLILSLISLVIFLNLRILSCLVNTFLENLGLVLFTSLFLVIFLYYIAKITNLELSLILYITVIFGISNIILWWKIKKTYEDFIKLNFNKLFLISWDFFIYILIFSVFLFIVLGYNIQNLSKEKIISFISSLNYFFEVINMGITPNSKVADALAKNLPQNIDEKTKKEMIKIAIAEINKKFNLNLKEESTFKEAISEYIINRIKELKNTPSTFVGIKIIVALIISLILRYLLIMIGYPLSLLSIFLFSLMKYFKLIEIKFEKIDKEIITI